MPHRVVGSSVLRKEVRGKLTGQACYVDDMSMPGMLHGATIRSSVPRGTICEVHFDSGVPWDEFTVVSAQDIPGRNLVALIYEDQPCLASGRVNHLHEPVLLIAHQDKDLLRKARNLVRSYRHLLAGDIPDRPHTFLDFNNEKESSPNANSDQTAVRTNARAKRA